MADFHPLPPPKDLHPSSASNYFGDDPPIQESVEEKIRYVFTDFPERCYTERYLIQFWAPVDIDGRRLLTTSDLPFVLGDKRFEEYRFCCMKYKYNIDVNKVDVEDEEDPTIICTGAHTTAFLNHIPELVEVEHEEDHQMTPLESSAFQCGLMHSVVLPVFYPSQSCCVGVIQYSASSLDYFFLVFKLLNVELEKVGLKTFDARQRLPYKTICGLQNGKDEIDIDEALNIIWDTHQAFNELSVALEKQGLKTFDAQEQLPYKTICGLQNAKDEIDEALKIISHTHLFPFAQVWIPCEDENQVAFSSSLQDIRTKRMLWLKLTGHNFDNFDDEQVACLEDYGTACYGLPLKMDKDFTGKTLENYEPHFVNDILELNDNKPQRLRHIHFPCSCFVICLRSTKTRDLDYVFEFLWSHDKRHNVILLESLLLTLERCLPSFTIASGAEVGDELSILDVQDSTESKRKYFKIFERNQLSLVSVTPKTGRRSEVEECLMPLKAKCKTTPIPSSHVSQAQKGGRQSKVEKCLMPSNAKGKTEERKFSREEIESEFGKTQKEAAEKLKIGLSTLKRKCREHGIFEWPGPQYMKRNVKQSHKSQSDTNEEEDNGGTIQEPSANIRETSLGENILTIKVKYADHCMIKFHLPITSATFEDIVKEINERFKLNHSDYMINYLDEDGDWILLSSDKDMRVCIRDHRNLNTTPINMQVLLRKI